MAREDYDVTTLRGAVRILRKHCIDMGSNCRTCCFYDPNSNVCRMFNNVPFQWSEFWCREDKTAGVPPTYEAGMDFIRKKKEEIKTDSKDLFVAFDYGEIQGAAKILIMLYPNRIEEILDELRKCTYEYEKKNI